MMKRFFNTAGPIKPELHYNIDPLRRWDLEEILMLIEQQKYFIIHVPRQTGKTSSLLALRDYLNEDGKYLSCYINIEPAQAARNNVGKGIKSVVAE